MSWRAHLPPEVWWLVGVFADEVLNMRALCRATARVRPERSLLYRHWSWIVDEDVRQCYNDVGDFVQELLNDIENRMWGGALERAHGSLRRALYARRTPRCQRRAYDGSLAYGDWVCLERRYRPARAHAAFRLPRMTVNGLRRRGRWQALALIF